MIHTSRRSQSLLLAFLALFPHTSYGMDSKLIAGTALGTSLAVTGTIIFIKRTFINPLITRINSLTDRLAASDKENAIVRAIATKPEIQKMVEVTNDPRFNDALTILPQLKIIWNTINQSTFMQQVATINDPTTQKALGAFVKAQDNLNDILRNPKHASPETLMSSFSLFVERFKDLTSHVNKSEKRLDSRVEKAETRIDAGVDKIGSFAEQQHALRSDVTSLQKKLETTEATQKKQGQTLKDTTTDAATLNTALTKLASSCDARLTKLEANVAVKNAPPSNVPQPSAPPAYGE